MKINYAMDYHSTFEIQGIEMGFRSEYNYFDRWYVKISQTTFLFPNILVFFSYSTCLYFGKSTLEIPSLLQAKSVANIDFV